MKVLYIDAFSGISGDMTVGALLALGVPLDLIQQQLNLLPLEGYAIRSAPRHVNGIAATKFDVEVSAHGHTHRAFRSIRSMLESSKMEPATQRRALAIFERLAEAEGLVHGVAPDDVEFHEVGAVDSIVDIVASAAGVTTLGVEAIYVSALPLGSGVVQSQHGPLPVPAPATVELLLGFPVRTGDGVGELVTPTGAAIVAALATAGTAPELRIQRVGYGAGERTLKDRPNLLRLVLGERVDASGHEDLLVIETNIDDLNPELYDYVMERLLSAGARDVYLAPVHMKKNRPGIVLSVLCDDRDREQLSAMILNETSAIGVRYHPVRRRILDRIISEVGTAYGSVRVKVALAPDGHRNVAPEYDDCKRLAAQQGVPIKRVYQAALAAALQLSERNK
jgi:pyridinium-3,5-bisthiocarboxylic acid mononucleotide nickel chelatase